MIKNLKLNFDIINKILDTGLVISFIFIGATIKDCNIDNKDNDTNCDKVEFISPLDSVDINSKTDRDLHKAKNISSNKKLKGNVNDEIENITKKHVVKDNETIYDICMKYYASPVLMADLLKYNKLDVIKTGDKLDIPAPSKLTSDENIFSITENMQEREFIFDINESSDDIFSEFDYVVQEGDSFASLATKFYGNIIYSLDIMRYNGIKELKVGSIIKIAPLEDLTKGYEDNNTWNVKR